MIHDSQQQQQQPTNNKEEVEPIFEKISPLPSILIGKVMHTPLHKQHPSDSLLFLPYILT